MSNEQNKFFTYVQKVTKIYNFSSDMIQCLV